MSKANNYSRKDKLKKELTKKEILLCSGGATLNAKLEALGWKDASKKQGVFKIFNKKSDLNKRRKFKVEVRRITENKSLSASRKQEIKYQDIARSGQYSSDYEKAFDIIQEHNKSEESKREEAKNAHKKSMSMPQNKNKNKNIDANIRKSIDQKSELEVLESKPNILLDDKTRVLETASGAETRSFPIEQEKTTLFKSKIQVPEMSDASLYSGGTVGESIFVERTKPKSFILTLFFSILTFLVFAVVLAGFAGIGTFYGIYKAYSQSMPPLDMTLITDQDQSSTLYDDKGELITTMMLYRNSEWAQISEIPDMLKNAFIAVEDVRFYYHNGVDLKRIAAAGMGTLVGGFDGGGSTVTQQLIKMQILGSEQSYKRKLQEAAMAIELEKSYTKDQILEGYLNSVPLGSQNYGVKAAAKDFFGKELTELTIRECAMIGGLTQNPSRYDPRANTYRRQADSMDLTNKRTDTVLKRMYTAGFINEDQLDKALVEDVKILEISEVKRIYDMPYFVEYAIYDVTSAFLKQRNLQDNKSNRNEIEKEILTKGYKIYTTVDREMQMQVQNSLTNWEKYPELQDPSSAIKVERLADDSIIETQQPQAAAVIIESSTGQIKALVGGREEPKQRKLWNRAYQSYMEVGSAIKPISIYAPALEKGAAASSVYLNYEAEIEGYGGERGHPLGGLQNQGPVTMRYGLTKSLNVVAARILFETVGLDASKNFLVKLGIDASRINTDGPGLALGTTAISPLEMSAAYATLANGGTYLQPISFTEVTTPDGIVVLDAEAIREKHEVFSPSTAYLLTSMLQDAVKTGTGTNAAIEGMNVAGKTGTNSNYKSVFFAGYTPYYASAIWIGHDDVQFKLNSGSTGGKYAAPLWQDYMQDVHKGLANKDFFDVGPRDLGLVEKRTCAISGQLATDVCESDRSHPPVTDWFAYKHIPTQSCEIHKWSNGVSVAVIPTDGAWENITKQQVRATIKNSSRKGSWSYSDYASNESALDEGLETIENGGTRSAGDVLTDAQNMIENEEEMDDETREEMLTLIETVNELVENESSDVALDSQVDKLDSIVKEKTKSEPQPKTPEFESEDIGFIEEE